MNLDQYTNLIKAVTSLLLLFFLGYIYKSCNKKEQSLPISQKIIIQNEIMQADSAILVIPFAYSDSQRTNFLQNYRRFR
jgi:cbb3-type cytochrome oxidase subunit 3